MDRCVETRSERVAADALVEHQAEVQRYFMRRLHPSRHDAEDLTQEVCARFLSSRHAAASIEPKLYLFGIARHVLADFLADRQRQRRHLISIGDPIEAALDYLQSAALRDPAESVSTAQLVDFLLRTLPSSQVAVLLAHEGDGY